MTETEVIEYLQVEKEEALRAAVNTMKASRIHSVEQLTSGMTQEMVFGCSPNPQPNP
jgi:hypothetical protein